MFRNLTNIEIIEAESIFLCIDWGVIPEDKAKEIMMNIRSNMKISS